MSVVRRRGQGGGQLCPDERKTPIEPGILEAKDIALSRRKPGFESRWGHSLQPASRRALVLRLSLISILVLCARAFVLLFRGLARFLARVSGLFDPPAVLARGRSSHQEQERKGD